MTKEQEKIKQEILEQQAQDEKWKDYELPVGFQPNRGYLLFAQIAIPVLPVLAALVCVLLLTLPLFGGRSVIATVSGIISASSMYRMRAIAPIFMALGVFFMSIEAASKVVESLTFDFTGVKKKTIKEGIAVFVGCGVLPLVVAVLGSSGIMSYAGFDMSIGVTMFIMAMLYLASTIAETVIKKDRKTENGEEPSYLHQNFLAVYKNKITLSEKKKNLLQEFVFLAVLIVLVVVMFIVPFVSQTEYLTQEKVDTLKEDVTIGEVCDMFGCYADVETQMIGTPEQGNAEIIGKTYYFYGVEMNKTIFTADRKFDLTSIAKYAKDKDKKISALVVHTDKSDDVTSFVFYDDLRTYDTQD